MPSRPLLPETSIVPHALETMASFQAETVREVKDAIAQHKVVVVGMAQNPHVRRARRVLKEAAVEFHYLEYGSYLSGWRRRLAVKLWSGWPTFPQIYVGGTLIGGANNVEAALRDGTLRALLDE